MMARRDYFPSYNLMVFLMVFYVSLKVGKSMKYFKARDFLEVVRYFFEIHVLKIPNFLYRKAFKTFSTRPLII